ncbi:MAG: DUF6054 family protein [Erysipelotrichaceae bacterium]|nr:DUF6054 family protein [Erysipelotrichaceae bacterium]
MAKLETEIVNSDFSRVLAEIENGILKRSMSASLEDGSDFRNDRVRCSVRVFERYSMAGSNRVSLTVTLLDAGDGVIHVSGITSGGSQALFFKINTIGEESFLDELESILRSF